eukprot:Pgem_evm1s10135
MYNYFNNNNYYNNNNNNKNTTITGSLLLRSDDHVNLFDLQQKQSIAECNITGVRRVVWNKDSTHVALLTKHSISICDRSLTQLCVINETTRVKSAAWDELGVL